MRCLLRDGSLSQAVSGRGLSVNVHKLRLRGEVKSELEVAEGWWGRLDFVYSLEDAHELEFEGKEDQAVKADET